MNKLNIVAYIHCGKCLDEYLNNEELKSKISPKDYAKTQCGWTKEGLQVWCNRHNCNVMHIDFQGQKHPADLSVAEDCVEAVEGGQ